MDSEYYNPSQSMHVLLPIKSIVEEFMSQVDVPSSLSGVNQRVHATTNIHINNIGALTLVPEQHSTA